MKISNSGMNKNLGGLENTKSSKLDKNPLASQSSQGRASMGDTQEASKVKLSEKAQMMNKATELAKADLDSVDEAKVARLQQMIDSGSYRVNAEAVADKLVDEHLLME